MRIALEILGCPTLWLLELELIIESEIFCFKEAKNSIAVYIGARSRSVILYACILYVKNIHCKY